MILCDTDLLDLVRNGLIKDPDYGLINPASIDIRIGKTYNHELHRNAFMTEFIPEKGIYLEPGEFILVSTLEYFNVPNGYAMDLRLKSSKARAGFDHSLAFWVDPGWCGVLTMEIRNNLRHSSLLLQTGERFAQILVHKLSGPSAKPYAGRYQNAIYVDRGDP